MSRRSRRRAARRRPAPPTPPATAAPSPRGRLQGSFGWPLLTALLIPAVLCVFAFLCVHGVLDQFNHNHRLGAGAQVADATVVEAHKGGPGKKRGYVIVEFSAAGRHVRAKVSDEYWWERNPSPGDRATVRYDPDNPGDYVRDDRVGPDNAGPIIGGTLALAFLIGAVAVLVWTLRD